jgi:hypothetical protein
VLQLFGQLQSFGQLLQSSPRVPLLQLLSLLQGQSATQLSGVSPQLQVPSPHGSAQPLQPPHWQVPSQMFCSAGPLQQPR